MLCFPAPGTGSQPTIPAGDSISHQPVVMLFGGDVLLGGHYAESVGDSVAIAFEALPALARADIAMANLENPVTTRGHKVPKPYNFRMHPRCLRALTDGGIKIVNIANNHIFDYGPEGLFDTISYLDSAGIRHVGAGRDREDAHRPVVLVVRGVRIGFLGYYGGGEAPGAGRRSPGVARRVKGEVISDIRSLREHRGVDFIVVNLHWGTENAHAPDREQVSFAHCLIDSGADAVVGHHPHVLQGIERYGRGIIAYSMGNFVFGGNERDTYNTGIFEIRLTSAGVRYAFVPVRVEKWHASLPAPMDSLSVVDSMRRLSSMFPRTIFTN